MQKEVKKALQGIECCKERRCDSCPFIDESPCWYAMLQAAENTIIDLREAMRCQ